MPFEPKFTITPNYCQCLSAWVKEGFIVIIDSSKKTRKYGLAREFMTIFDE